MSKRKEDIRHMPTKAWLKRYGVPVATGSAGIILLPINLPAGVALESASLVSQYMLTRKKRKKLKRVV